MKLVIGLEIGETGAPIELADAIIKHYMKDVNDYNVEACRKSELAEVAEHIQVYLKHNRAGVDI